MEAGRLRHLVQIQQNSPTQNAYGEPTAVWSTVATVWAAIEPMNARERQQANEVYEDISHRVRMRYREGVVTENRLRFGTRTLEISGIEVPDERGAEMVLHCREAR